MSLSLSYFFFCWGAGRKQKFICLLLTGEALTQSSLLEADGENGDGMVTMTTNVGPMNLHHAMLRSPGGRFAQVWQGKPQYTQGGQNNKTSHKTIARNYSVKLTMCCCWCPVKCFFNHCLWQPSFLVFAKVVWTLKMFSFGFLHN